MSAPNTFSGRIVPEEAKFALEHSGVEYSGDFAIGDGQLTISGERRAVARAARAIASKSKMFFVSEGRSHHIALFLANLGDENDAYDDITEASNFPAHIQHVKLI